MHLLIQLITVYLGALGFSLVFHIRGKKLIYTSLGGLLTWIIYLAAVAVTSNDYIGALVAALLLTTYAELIARWDKCPVTVILVAAIIPLIPGNALYQTINAAMQKNWNLFFERGTYTLLFAGSLAAGILAGTSIFYPVKCLMRRGHFSR